MTIIILLLIIPIFAFNDLEPVYRNRQWKVFWTYAAIMTLLVFIAVLVTLDVEIPSPIAPINKLVALIFGLPAEQ
jgi:hypothetical protein